MTTACFRDSISPESVDTHLSGMTDEALLLEYRRTGDEALFSELVLRYEQELYAFLYRRFENATLAEDAFQTAFLRVHMRAGQFEEGRKFRPWLYTIATNSAVDMLRRGRRRQSASLNAPVGGDEGEETQLLDTLSTTGTLPSDRIEALEREAECRRAVTRLPERIRIVVDLIFFQGLKYREAAEVLSIPIGTVKSRLHQAMLKLRVQLNEGGDDGGKTSRLTPLADSSAA